MKTWLLIALLAAIVAGSFLFTASVAERSAEVEKMLVPGGADRQEAVAKPTAAVHVPRPDEASVSGSAKKPVPAVAEADSLAIRQGLDQLAKLPAGEQAIALGQKLENAITPRNAAVFVGALLTADHPAVERTAHGALSRMADSETILSLVRRYGSTPEDRRGRVLQVLENARNPAATSGLIEVVSSDTSEKRSPLLVSAMNGLAGIATTESVGFLIRQVATVNETFALMALERVNTEQGREMIRAAAAGNKDSEGIAPELLAALGRIVGQK